MSSYAERLALIAGNLGRFLLPSQMVQLSARNVGASKMVKRFFRGDALQDIAAQALRWEAEGAHTLYFTLNPLRPDIAGDGTRPGGPARYARDEDVIARRWAMIDVEHAEHSNGLSATEAERVASWEVLQRVRGIMAAQGFTGEILADSGNGWHAFYPVDLPNDDATKQRFKAFLRGLAERCDDEYAHVDTDTYKAVQYAKVYGCLNRKGEATDERPHRFTQLIEGV